MTKKKKFVLHDVSSSCGWGKLTAIMGPTKRFIFPCPLFISFPRLIPVRFISGKTTLLQILAGNISPANLDLEGEILYNDKPIDFSLEPWQRCAYVDSLDEMTRDLTVRDSVTYSMRLRCSNKAALSVVEENVNRTLTVLNLNYVADTKTKKLTAGELRLVSIAEEIVNGSPLLFVDEPLAGLSVKETSVLMKTFREMVNKDQTVVGTFREPSTEVIPCVIRNKML